MSLAPTTPDALPAGELITLGGGCFWCTEAVFEQVRGVLAVEPGYCNGQVLQPTYEQVCTGETGHAEVVQVRFDPAQIGLDQVLAIFFATHDPTQLNRQGHDTGTQYRSGVYWHQPAQEPMIRAVLAEVQQALDGRAVTEVQARANYSTAEAYHHHYYARHPYQGYCAAVIGPKLEKFRKVFRDHLIG